MSVWVGYVNAKQIECTYETKPCNVVPNDLDGVYPRAIIESFIEYGLSHSDVTGQSGYCPGDGVGEIGEAGDQGLDGLLLLDKGD